LLPTSSLRKLRREYAKDAYVFVSERGGPIGPIGFHRLVQRIREVAKMPFPIHPHMLRHGIKFTDGIEVVRSQAQTAAA
jgi:type 1 fimbriae regulatory protein FimB/type 1 fimbriae regulatory protein FimE